MCERELSTKSLTTPPRIKQGRVLSAANEARLSAALREIVAILEDAGVDAGLTPDNMDQPDVDMTAQAGKYTIVAAKNYQGDSIEHTTKRFLASAIFADREQLTKSAASLNALLDCSIATIASA